MVEVDACVLVVNVPAMAPFPNVAGYGRPCKICTLNALQSNTFGLGVIRNHSSAICFLNNPCFQMSSASQVEGTSFPSYLRSASSFSERQAASWDSVLEFKLVPNDTMFCVKKVINTAKPDSVYCDPTWKSLLASSRRGDLIKSATIKISSHKKHSPASEIKLWWWHRLPSHKKI